MVRLENFPQPNPQAGDEVFIIAQVAGNLTATTTSSSPPLVIFDVNGFDQPHVTMEDRGGGVFRASLGVFDNAGRVVRYQVAAEDADGNTMTSEERKFEVQAAHVKRSDVLLVVDSREDGLVRRTGGFYRGALFWAGVPYDFWDASLLGPPFLNDLIPYRHGAVIWAAPEYDSWLWNHPDPERVRGHLEAYLLEGVSLFMSGQQIAEHFRERGSPGREWLVRNLRVAFRDCCAPNNVIGEAGDVIGDGLDFGLEGGDGTNNSHSPALLFKGFDADTVFSYYDTSTTQTHGIAGVRSQRGQSKTVFLGFNFESINVSSTRIEVMSRVMDWINPTCNGRASTIDGTDGPDTIYGTDGPDVIVGHDGLNVIFALGGDDIVCGGRVGTWSREAPGTTGFGASEAQTRSTEVLAATRLSATSARTS